MCSLHQAQLRPVQGRQAQGLRPEGDAHGLGVLHLKLIGTVAMSSDPPRGDWDVR